MHTLLFALALSGCTTVPSPSTEPPITPSRDTGSFAPEDAAYAERAMTDAREPLWLRDTGTRTPHEQLVLDATDRSER